MGWGASFGTIVGKPHKKLFLMAVLLRLHPPPYELNGLRKKKIKKSFPLMAGPLPSPFHGKAITKKKIVASLIPSLWRLVWFDIGQSPH